MWKSRKEDETRPAPAPPSPPAPAPVSASVPPSVTRQVENRMPEIPRSAATAHIGKSVIIKGQLSGSEDLYLDGEVEGTVDLPGHTLTVGPSARVRANISARVVSIQGTVTGNVRGSDKVELKNSAVLTGDIATKRIAIDDGAFFKGGVDIQKDTTPDPRQATTPAASSSSGTTPSTPHATPTGGGGSSSSAAATPSTPSTPSSSGTQPSGTVTSSGKTTRS
jgi:cytoskeletal protein CcmA (bactofilin family)